MMRVVIPIGAEAPVMLGNAGKVSRPSRWLFSG